MQVKAISIKQEEKVKDTLIKQDCIIADAAKLVLWGESVSTLAEQFCYQLSGVTVSIYLFQRMIFS